MATHHTVNKALILILPLVLCILTNVVIVIMFSLTKGRPQNSLIYKLLTVQNLCSHLAHVEGAWGRKDSGKPERNPFAFDPGRRVGLIHHRWFCCQNSPQEKLHSQPQCCRIIWCVGRQFSHLCSLYCCQSCKLFTI